MSPDADELARALDDLKHGEPKRPTPARRPAAPPAPDPTPAPRPSTPKLTPVAQARLNALRQSVELKRTLIPPLLTMGAALLLCGSIWFVLPKDNPLRLAGTPALALALVGVGVLCLGLAAFNMLGVRKAIA